MWPPLFLSAEVDWRRERHDFQGQYAREPSPMSSMLLRRLLRQVADTVRARRPDMPSPWHNTIASRASRDVLLSAAEASGGPGVAHRHGPPHVGGGRGEAVHMDNHAAPAGGVRTFDFAGSIVSIGRTLAAASLRGAPLLRQCKRSMAITRRSANCCSNGTSAPSPFTVTPHHHKEERQAVVLALTRLRALGYRSRFFFFLYVHFQIPFVCSLVQQSRRHRCRAKEKHETQLQPCSMPSSTLRKCHLAKFGVGYFCWVSKSALFLVPLHGRTRSIYRIAR